MHQLKMVVVLGLLGLVTACGADDEAVQGKPVADTVGQADAATGDGLISDGAGGVDGLVAQDTIGIADGAAKLDGASEDATAGDGSNGDGATGDGATGDGATGDDATGDGATGDDATGDDATGGDATDQDGSGGGDAIATCPGGLGCSCVKLDDCGGQLVCNGPTGSGKCGKPCGKTDPADEACDGVDNDCDGETDEATCADSACATSACAADGDGKFACVATAKDGLCDDGDACTAADGCKGGVCVGVGIDCDDNNPCTADSCDKAVGCDKKAIAGACDDGNACTTEDGCTDGGCIGKAKVCDDKNPCTKDSCDAGGTCVTALDNGVACDDGDACSDKDACSGGACVGSAIVCSDGNPCTVDACKDGGCVVLAGDGGCDDGNPCTATDVCKNGVCAGAKADCDDSNPCTKDSCDLAVGCTSTIDDASACDDDDACTSSDSCSGGACTGTLKACDDNNPCTDDSCDKAADGGKGGCVAKANSASCDDGDACTSDDACIGSACKGGGAPDCDDDNACTKDSCGGGACAHAIDAAAACDDGSACTEKDACDAGKCVGAALSCDDGNACTDDACDAKAGCTKAPNSGSCDDGNACTSEDGCTDGICGGKTKSDAECDDKNSCTKDACDPTIGCKSTATQGAACDDGNVCTGKDTCGADGSCLPGDNQCECKVDGDCKDDSDQCNGSPVCKAGKCVVDPATVVVCDPSGDSPCSVATCAPSSGDCALAPANEGKFCVDGNPCTLGNACQKGACADGAKDKCDDGDVCSADACDALSGKCSATAIDGCVPCVDISACDDSNACTKDACINGVCANDPIKGCSVGPQLSTHNFKLSANKLDAGATVDVTFDITNNGLSTADKYEVYVLLSSDATADKGDVIVLKIAGASLGSKKSISMKATVKIPANAKSGAYQLLIVADGANVIDEDDEQDNVAAATVTIVAKPDLVFTSYKTDKSFYGSGTYITWTSNVANLGSADATVATTMRVYASADDKLGGDTYLAQFTVGALKSGASQAVNSLIKLPALADGTYTLFAVLDYAFKLSESDETNNVVSVKIQIGPVANLRPTVLTMKSMVAGATVDMSYSVINDGKQTAAARTDKLWLSKNVTVGAGDVLLGTYSRGELAAGKTAAFAEKVKIPIETANGSWYVIVVVDSELEVPEVSEADNTRLVAISVAGLADLVPTLVSTPPPTLPNSKATLSIRVDNKGTVASGASVARLYLSADNTVSKDDIALGVVGIAATAAGQFRTANVSVTYAVKPGTYNVLLVADADAKVVEVSETNNLVSKSIKILDKADIVPSAAKLSSDKLPAGTQLKVTWTDANKGDDTFGGFIDTVYLSADDKVGSSDIILGNVNSAVLAGGTSANRAITATVPLSVTPGDYNVLVFSDRSNLLAESDETNNLIKVAITVEAPQMPDLKILSAEVLGVTTTIAVGDDFSVQAQETNAGLTDAGSYQGTWYLSVDALLSADDIALKAVSRPGLAAGKSATVATTLRLPSNTKAGTRYLFYVADSGNAVKESVETNNSSMATKITASARPDLHVYGFVATPSYGTTGTSVVLKFTVRNGGGAASGAFQIKTLVSVDNTVIDLAKDVVVATWNQKPLAIGATAAVTALFKMPKVDAGQQIWIGAYADSGSVINEANEANNTGSIAFSTISAEKKPNLFAESVTVSKTTVAVGQKVNVTAIYRNLGGAPTGSWKAKLVFAKAPGVLDGAVEVATSTEGSLNPNASAKRTWTVTLPLSLPSTMRYMHVIADPDNTIAETIESDNSGWVAMTIQQLPNLEVVSIAAPTTVKSAAYNTFTVVVRNSGLANAPAAQLRFRGSTDANITTADASLSLQLVQLSAGQTLTIQRALPVDASWKGKKIYFAAIIDENNAITETQEDDNSKAVAVAVQ